MWNSAGSAPNGLMKVRSFHLEPNVVHVFVEDRLWNPQPLGGIKHVFIGKK